jgi:uncharacterized protein YdeI (YjbR/CyaY-like superfamily)
LDLALCFGWIDSMIRRIDDLKYVMRFTPRRPGSIWSRSNILRVETLTKEGKMTAHGAALFSEGNAEISSAEKPKSGEASFPPQFLKAIKKNEKASKNFQKLAPGYKRRYLKWITSAKTEETRARRVEQAVDLIAKNVKSLMKIDKCVSGGLFFRLSFIRSPSVAFFEIRNGRVDPVGPTSKHRGQIFKICYCAVLSV